MAAPAPLILAVDDDPTIRALLADFLGEEGYRICTRPAITLSEVLGLAPDLLLMDRGVDPDGHILALVEALRNEPAGRRLPVVLVTGAVEQVRREQERLDGLRVGVLLKPFDLEELLEQVGACLVPARESAPAT